MNYTLLIIDDDPAMHFVLKDMLEDEYKLVHTTTAQQGIDMLSENPFYPFG